jgi:hypothetical protein
MGDMMRAAQLLAVCAALFAAGCGSTSPTDAGSGTGTPTTGTATFSVDATGSLAVYVLGSHSPSFTYSTLEILSGVYGSTATSYPSFGFEGQLPGGSLPTGTYGPTDITAETTYLNASMESWGQSSATILFGTFRLMLSSVGSPSTVGGDTVWYASHGTLTATMVPINGNTETGSIIVNVTF